MKPISHHRGSALIITMLVVAAISTAAFGLSRIFLADVRIASSLEDSLKSYYLAEAGVEEGLLRYRIDRNDFSLNEVPLSGSPITRTFPEGEYNLHTYFLTTGVVNTTTEYDNGLGNTDFPNGDVRQDQTIEIATPAGVGNVELEWLWLDGSGPSQDDCGVEITSVLTGSGPSGVNFEKVVSEGNTNQGTSAEAGGRVAIRAKPLCEDLNFISFAPQNGQIGRTIQTIESTGTLGRAKRKLQATLNRRSGAIVGLFDFVLGSEGDLIKP